MSVIEWICDCCGAYLGQWDDHKWIDGEDRCEDCDEHTVHCDEYRAVELAATGWHTITGRGTVATVDLRQTPRPINIGENVVIDGTLYTIVGIEQARILTDPPIDDPVVGLIVRKLP